MQLNVRDELKFSCKDMVTLHLFCPRGPSCVMGGVMSTSWSYSNFPRDCGYTVVRVLMGDYGYTTWL